MELELIDKLRRRLPSHPQLRLGVGDDAAVLRLAERADCVATADLLAEGVHFNLDDVDAPRVGRKALAVNLSDLAAMAARPVAAVVSLLLPHGDALQLSLSLFEGMIPLAEEFHTAIAGGDTNCWSGPLVVNVTAIGETTARGPLRRDGARPGDAILVTGEFGGSRLGKEFDFRPRVDEALLLHGNYQLHAGIDVSDGLALDLSRICRASDCGAMLELDRVPVSPAARRVASGADDGRTPLGHALGDGEDFELILAVPHDDAEAIIRQQPLSIPVTKIGRFCEQSGLWQSTDGAPTPIEPRGFQHGT